MENDSQMRNFKDFLLLYNQMTENCFGKCVDEMNSRDLNKDEAGCVHRCSAKFINANHRMMAIYVDVQAALVSKRIEEATAKEQVQQNS